MPGGEALSALVVVDRVWVVPDVLCEAFECLGEVLAVAELGEAVGGRDSLGRIGEPGRGDAEEPGGLAQRARLGGLDELEGGQSP
ncbi:hypothetical protein [Embleya sp. MST-111070]|uniref:hypothetical protein n=1 Tax=Embleya sp. MST-111070 TaxID=3398231 RepID=UPI003F739A5A